MTASLYIFSGHSPGKGTLCTDAVNLEGDIKATALRILQKYNALEHSTGDPQAIWLELHVGGELVCEYTLGANDTLIAGLPVGGV